MLRECVGEDVKIPKGRVGSGGRADRWQGRDLFHLHESRIGCSR